MDFGGPCFWRSSEDIIHFCSPQVPALRLDNDDARTTIYFLSNFETVVIPDNQVHDGRCEDLSRQYDGAGKYRRC
jgi:hypothetical protein